jgi:hypothetical protein
LGADVMFLFRVVRQGPADLLVDGSAVQVVGGLDNLAEDLRTAWCHNGNRDDSDR